MALYYEKQTEPKENKFEENRSEQPDYQISLSDVNRSTDKMKKIVDEITIAIENAHNITYENKILTDEIKNKLSRKSDEVEKLQEKLEQTKKRVELDTRKVSELMIEINEIKIAIEKIKEVERNLNQKYLEQSQSELVNALVKITSDAEKAQSDLNVSKKIEEITFKKLEDSEIDYNRLKKYTLNKINETEKMTANVSMATKHIISSYDEIAIVSKELLQSAVNIVKEEKNYELEQQQSQ